MSVRNEDIKVGAVIRSLSSGATLHIAEVTSHDVGGASVNGRHPRRVAIHSILGGSWVLDTPTLDAECSRCRKMYASGTGHPKVALCSDCSAHAPPDPGDYCGMCKTSGGCRHT